MDHLPEISTADLKEHHTALCTRLPLVQDGDKQELLCELVATEKLLRARGVGPEFDNDDPGDLDMPVTDSPFFLSAP